MSVHVVTFNNELTIRACITSVRKQSLRDITILVVDNASSDRTRQIVQSMGVPLIKNAKNLGYAVAHNMAISQTQSTYVLTLNPDVVLGKDFLRHMTDALDDNPRVGSAAGLLYRVDRLDDFPAVVDGAGLFIRRNRRQGLREEGRLADSVPRRPVSIFGPDGAAAFYRRAMLEDIRLADEYFDEDFFMHKEDVDVCWRARLRGWNALFVPQATAKHIRTFRAGQRARVSDELKAMAVRNRYLLMIKNESPALFLRDLLPIAFYDVGIFFYILLKERRSLVAYKQVISMAQTMLNKRKLIYTRRKVTDTAMSRWFI